MPNNLAIYKNSNSYFLENTLSNVIVNQADIQHYNDVVILNIHTNNQSEFFLLGTLLLIAKDFGFPEVIIKNKNIKKTFEQDTVNTAKFYYEIALKFLRKITKEKINLTFELLDNVIKTSNLPIPAEETSHLTVLKQLSEYICQLQKTNIHKFFNFCYRFDLPEKYFNIYMNSCEDLALLFIAREMQRYSYKKYYS